MKVLVTGATSFIGRRLLCKLVLSGYDCTAIVRKGKGQFLNSDIGCKIVELEMHEYGQIGKYFPNADCLVNLAWLGTRGDSRMKHDVQMKSYKYTMDAIKSMADTSCKVIMTAGSQAEYGQVDGIISEKTNPKPNTEYGKFKLQLYNEASDFCENKGIRLIEPRFFSLYGPNDYDNTMIISIMKKMIKNEDCNLTECIQLWDFLYIDDAVDGLAMLMDRKDAFGAFNFASGDTRLLKSYVEEMKVLLNSKSEVKYGAVPYPSTGMVSFKPDITKLQSFEWVPKTTFREGIMEVKKYIRF